MRIILLLLFGLGLHASAGTIYLKPGTDVIQPAVDSAKHGDVIILEPGIYLNTGVVSLNKRLTLASRFFETNDYTDRDRCIIRTGKKEGDWFIIEADGRNADDCARVIGLFFQGNGEHSVNGFTQ